MLLSFGFVSGLFAKRIDIFHNKLNVMDRIQVASEF